MFGEESQHAQGQGRVKREWCINNCRFYKLTGTEKHPTPQLHLLQASQDLRRSSQLLLCPITTTSRHFVNEDRVIKRGLCGTMFSCQRLSTSVAQCLLKLKEARGGAMLCNKQKHHNSEMTSGQRDPITSWRVKETSCGTGDHVWREHEINRFFQL